MTVDYFWLVTAIMCLAGAIFCSVRWFGVQRDLHLKKCLFVSAMLLGFVTFLIMAFYQTQ